jgi:ketosteroid isomerase-like protein
MNGGKEMGRFTKTTGTTGVMALALAAVLGLGVGHAAAQVPTDPASVLVAFEKTVGVDVDAGLAMMTDDAVLKITPAPQGTTGLWTGKAEIRQGLQYSVDHKVKREVVGAPQVDGTKITDTVMTTNDFFQMIGVAPVQFSTEAVVEGGKIKSFVTVIAPSEQGRVSAAAKAFQAAHAAPAQPDPAAIYLAFANGVGSADIDGTLAMVTDDAVLKITPAPQGTTGLWTGKAEIRQALEYARDQSVHHQFPTAPRVDGNKVTAMALLTNSVFQQWGVAPVQFTSEAIIEGGKIKSFTNTIVPSELARVGAGAKAFQAAHAAPAPTGMPQTGAGESTSLFLPGLLMMALCLVTAGLVVRRSRARA